MFEADITKVVEEMAVHIRETEEDFILDTIYPHCQEILQRKINKAELKQIILRGSRPKGKWKNGDSICPCCGEDKFKDLDADIWSDWKPKYCPNCGAMMDRGEEDEDSD